MSGGGGGAQDTYAQDMSGEISRQQWDDYQTRFVPVENEIIDSIGNKGLQAAAVGRAASTTNQQFDASTGVTERALSRRGRTLDAAQKEALDRQVGLGRGAGVAEAKNLTRRSLRDRDLAMMGKMISTGRGLADSGTDGLASVAQMEQSRNSTNKQLAAQKSANRTAAVATVAGAAIMVF